MSKIIQKSSVYILFIKFCKSITFYQLTKATVLNTTTFSISQLNQLIKKNLNKETDFTYSSVYYILLN